MSPKLRTVLFAISILVAVIVTGIIGYMLIEDFEFIDALYMTIITVSTVGFGEVKPLETDGKIFTAMLCLASIGAVTYAVTVIGGFVFDQRLKKLLHYDKSRKIGKMKKHVIICGYGRNGRQAAEELRTLGVTFVVIEEKDEVIAKYMNHKVSFVKGNATHDEILEEAGILNAMAIISAFPNDADNLFVVISARALNEKIRIISRASSLVSEKKLRVAGADRVVLPEKVGGAHMANLVSRSNVFEFLERLSIHGDSPTSLEEITCEDLSPKLLNKSIYELSVRRKSGANIIGFKTPDGVYRINPTPDTKIIADSKLFVLGTPKQIDEMKKILQEK